MKLSNRFQNVSRSFLGLAVVIVIAIAVNVILSTFNLRKDLTEEKLYTLSEGTRGILKDLPEPVTLKLFFNGSNAEVPIQIKSFVRRVEDLLTEYRVHGKGNIIIEQYDPKPDSDAEEWAQRYGLSGQSLGFMGPMLYLGLVATGGDADATLPVLDPQAEQMLEYNLTRMITRVATPNKPVVGVMSSLSVMGSPAPPYPMPGQPPPSPGWFTFKDLGKDYDVREIGMDVDRISDEIDSLVLVHPKDLSDSAQFAIDQYVLRGGTLLVFVDPLCVTALESQQPQMQGMPSNASNLTRLFPAWGITFDAAKVVADLDASSRLRMGNGNQVQESPVWLSLHKQNMNAEDILTARLEFVMLPYAGAFTVADDKDIEVTTLLSASKRSSLVDAMTAQYSIDGIRRAFKSGNEEMALAVRLHGLFKTAYPDGAPKADGEAPAADAAGEGPDTSLKASTEKSTILLVGDADMLFDRFAVQAMNFLGHQAHQPINDNLAFFLNALEQTSGSSALVGIRTRGKTERPFDVVLDLQREAQARYLAEETRLQEELMTAQQRLSSLQSQKDKSQQFILSAQQQREIQNFQEQVRLTKKELKLVRRSLREDIEKLGVKIKVINILLIPALVIVAGIAFGVYRKKKTRR
jgi:ABC-type uncharacterized transport system involved in gliding motility auxiliary subunit